MSADTSAPPTDAVRVERAARAVVAEHDPRSVPREELFGALFDAGLAFVGFPEGLGGLGLSRGLQAVVDGVVTEAGGPRGFAINPIGYGMGAPVVVEYAQTRELARDWLRPLATCEEIWCQLFSEPGAGSDVAGLSTTAVRDGDEWVLNGQKVWTTLAHVSRWAMVVARTDPDVPKHRGLTYFVLDMDQPGVDVRPLRQMTGQAEFNEVYLNDARIPDAHRLGDVGAGWRVAITTLMNERTAIGGVTGSRGSGRSPRRSACGRPVRTGTPRCCATGWPGCGPGPRRTGSRWPARGAPRPQGSQGRRGRCPNWSPPS